METKTKVIVVIFCILLIAAAVLLGVFLTMEEEEKYSLVIVGDQGQVEYFKRKYDEVKPLEISNQEKIDKIFKDTTYNINDKKCIITDNGKKIDFTDLNSADAKKEGLYNFEGIFYTNNFVSQVNSASGIVFLGDSIYPENKKLAELTGKNAVLGSQDKWNTRLVCGWNIFIEHLKKIKLMNKDYQLSDKVFMLTGNHSFDVSFNLEKRIVKSLENPTDSSYFYQWDEKSQKAVLVNNSDKNSYSYLRKVSIYPKNGRAITFIDINTTPFVCLGLVQNEAEYNDASKCPFDSYLIERWSYSQVTNYYLAFYDVVKNLNPEHWNVIRGHHPPVNFEDGDCSLFFDVTIEGVTYNLMNKFEERNVRVFFGSHIHAQAVMAMPFRKTAIRTRGDKISAQKDGNYCNVNNLKATSEELMDVDNVCTQTNFDLDLSKEKLMIIFINGNSGRKFDPISNGLRSAHGNTVWSKKQTVSYNGKVQDAYGYSYAEFEKEKLVFKFYEMDNVSDRVDTTVSSTFNVKFDETVSKNFLKETKTSS